MALGTGVRLYLLGDKALWWDEGWSVYLARKPALQIILEAASTQHPPLHYLYLHYWFMLVGDGEFAARVSSVLFGVATLPLAYLLGVRVGGRAVGMGAALFLAIAPFHVHWSQEIRMYTAATFCVTASLLFCLRFSARPSPWSWAGYVLATTSMLYLHYGTALLVVIANVVFAIGWWSGGYGRRRLGAWVLAQLAVVAALLPWLFLYLQHTTIRSATPPTPPLQYLEC